MAGPELATLKLSPGSCLLMLPLTPSAPAGSTPEPKAAPKAALADLQPVPGERIYAIGDVHGRQDLFERLIALIDADARSRRTLRSRIIVLGDVIDRGPNSAALIRRLKAYTEHSDRFVVLKGNHEQLMVGALEGDYGLLRAWLDLGGVETLLSFGVGRDLVEGGAAYPLLRAARDLISPDVLSWVDHLPLHFRSGDIVFVHAGVRPNIPFRKQRAEDFLWIGRDFLDSEEQRGFLTVHGHTISEEGPVTTSNRIGVDTGAYRTGQLTAVGLEGGQRWFIST